MKKLKLRRFKKSDGTILGKAQTLMCGTPGEFKRQFKKCNPIPQPKANVIKPILNTDMLAIYDQQGD